MYNPYQYPPSSYSPAGYSRFPQSAQVPLSVSLGGNTMNYVIDVSYALRPVYLNRSSVPAYPRPYYPHYTNSSPDYYSTYGSNYPPSHSPHLPYFRKPKFTHFQRKPLQHQKHLTSEPPKKPWRLANYRDFSKYTKVQDDIANDRVGFSRKIDDAEELPSKPIASDVSIYDQTFSEEMSEIPLKQDQGDEVSSQHSSVLIRELGQMTIGQFGQLSGLKSSVKDEQESDTM